MSLTPMQVWLFVMSAATVGSLMSFGMLALWLWSYGRWERWKR